MHGKRFLILRESTKLLGALAALAVVLIAGCDRTDEIAEQSRSADESPARFVSMDGAIASSNASSKLSADGSAKQLISQVTQVYAHASSYRDRAYVRLLYTLDGQPVEDRAPLEVAFVRGAENGSPLTSYGRSGLGLRVYSASAGPSPDSARWHFRCEDAQVDSEGALPVVLSRQQPGHITLQWLLADPWAADCLSAGLVGFPLQLALLLDRTGYERSSAPEVRIGGTILQVLAERGTRRSPVSVDGHLCETIVAPVYGGTVAAWIDQEKKILRRVQFPKSALPGQMLRDSRITDIQLTIEFAAADIDAQIDLAYYGPAFDPQSLYLTHFVAPPVSVDDRTLGRRAPAFFLEDPSQRVVLESSVANRDSKILVLAWLANHPAAEVAAGQLKSVEQQLLSDAPNLAAQVEFVSVWAEPTPPLGETFASLPAAWHLPGRLTLDRRAMGRDLFEVEEAPTVVVLDTQNRVQARFQRGNPLLHKLLPDLLSRLSRGEDVAASTLLQNSQVNSRYAAALHQNVAPDNVARLPDRPREYLPLAFALQRGEQVKVDGTVVAVDSAGSEGTWVLGDRGVLQLIGPERVVRRQVKASSSFPEGTSLCCESGRVLAIVLPDGRGQVLQFDSSSEPHVTEFDAGFVAETAQWVSFGEFAEGHALKGEAGKRLALIGKDRMAIIDPQSGDQLEAPLPARANGLLTGPTVLLRDGQLEPLQLDGRLDSVKRPERLPFAPAVSRWRKVSLKTDVPEFQQVTFGKVWLAPGEVGVILLDADLRPIWHHRLSSEASSNVHMVCGCAVEGECVFALVDTGGTVNVFRTQPASANGSAAPVQVVVDNFRLPSDVIGIDLLPNTGGETKSVTLRAIHPSDFVEYSLSW